MPRLRRHQRRVATVLPLTAAYPAVPVSLVIGWDDVQLDQTLEQYGRLREAGGRRPADRRPLRPPPSPSSPPQPSGQDSGTSWKVWAVSPAVQAHCWSWVPLAVERLVTSRHSLPLLRAVKV
jgi:hypothetical protein